MGIGKRQPGISYEAFDVLQTPIWVYAIHPLRLVWANAAAQTWLGSRDLAEQTPSCDFGLDHSSVLERLQRYCEAVGQGKTLGEIWSLRGDGHDLVFYGLGQGIDLEDGHRGLLIEAHGLMGRTTQQAMLEAIPDLILRMNREGLCLDLMSGGEIPLWHPLPQGTPASIYDLLPQHLADLRVYHVRQALDTGQRKIYRQRLDIAGQIRHEEVRIVPMGPDEALLMVRDISQMVRAEGVLLEQSKLFQQQAQRDRLLAQVTQRISQSLELQAILDTAVQELRLLLQTQRVLVYRFTDSDGGGEVVAESVEPGWWALRYRTVEDRCFSVHGQIMQDYRQGRIQRTADIYTAPLSSCYLAMLSQLQVRANLVLPILQGDHLWGLLSCQQCDAPRAWTDLEVETLAQLASQLAIAIQQSELYQQLQRANQQLQHVATHDKLTGLPNRRYFDDYLEQEWRRLTREKAPLSLILCDIDYFKQYNDAYGHLAGDDCLVQVAQAIPRAIKRPADLAARYGGEEFAIILPNTDLSGAVTTGELIRQEISQAQITHRYSLIKPYVTASLGIACTQPSLGVHPQQLTDRADQALYQAKQTGRDRSCTAEA